MKKEIWEDIEGYEGLYQVSNLGRVKSLNYKNRGIEKLLKQFEDSKGYLKVGLSKNKKSKHLFVHRLVAKAFIPNLNNYPIINHKDENPLNNSINNLEWCTYKYNNNYGTKKERISKANKGKKRTAEMNKKQSERQRGKYIGCLNPAFGTHTNGNKIICLNNSIIYPSARQAGIELDLDNSTISKICKGKKKSIHGYKFMYYKDYIKQVNTEITIESKDSIAS
ncbi:NUMOD4 domain-containing protein [Clostridium tetani]|uniref:NUMOD4 domain-containing protein n=1 Tax=Clostridium tetani TaxID=1513 RepID=UPI00100B530B|nr:NUMOD4 domain-containing protein [Clostridium tetani]RXM57212.1 HNH endonuclease [Clostridium tetani]